MPLCKQSAPRAIVLLLCALCVLCLPLVPLREAAAQPVQITPVTELPLSASPIAPPPPPPWQQGRPEALRGSTLTPNAPGLSARPAAEIKLDKIKLPAGFHIELWADGLANAGAIAIGDKGTVFVGTRLLDSVYAVVEKDGKRQAKVLLKGLHRPAGVAFYKGDLYVAEVSRILRYKAIEDSLDNPPKPEVIFDALPADEIHGAKTLAIGPDGWLYFNIGAPCNLCVPPDTHAQITRVDPVRGIRETVVRGVRDSLGITFHPVTKELWFTSNGRDWLGEDVPNDTLVHVTGKGMNMGFPYCHQGDIVDPDIGRGRACEEFNTPALKLGPHVAPLGLRFYTGKMFPPDYRNRLFIANHGSWNRTARTGYNLMQVTLDARGKPLKYEPFAEGWLDGNNYWGRPVDVQVMADGALLVSDDETGALYRISYRKP